MLSKSSIPRDDVALKGGALMKWSAHNNEIWNLILTPWAAEQDASGTCVKKSHLRFIEVYFCTLSFRFSRFHTPRPTYPLSLSRRHNPSFPRVFVCGPAERPRPGASAAHAHSTEWISTSHFLFLFWDSAPLESVNGLDLSCPLLRTYSCKTTKPIL